jgi:hypothetical protein
VPFVLLSLPSGVWLDRVRKLPVYVAGELTIGLAVASVPLAWWWAGSMGWLYVVGFMIGTVHTVAGTAAQIVLTQVVPRERLVEAHAKNALATVGRRVAGPGWPAALIKVFGAPLALLVDAVLLLGRPDPARHAGARAACRTPRARASFWRDLKEGLRFVRGKRLLVALAVLMGVWQMCHYAALVVQILVATRTLGLSEQPWACATWAGRGHDQPAACGAGASASASAPGPAWCWALPSAGRLAAARPWRRPMPGAWPPSRRCWRCSAWARCSSSSTSWRCARR